MVCSEFSLIPNEWIRFHFKQNLTKCHLAHASIIAIDSQMAFPPTATYFTDVAEKKLLLLNDKIFLAFSMRSAQIYFECRKKRSTGYRNG